MSVEKPPLTAENSKIALTKNLWENLSGTYKGVLLMLLGSSLFAISHVFFKLAGEQINPFAVAFWNDIFALITILLLSLKIGGIRESLDSKNKRYHLLRSVSLTLLFLCMIKSFSLLPLANTLAIAFASPLIGTILCLVFLKEKPDFLQWIAILVGFTGVFITVNPSFQEFDTRMIWPLLGALCGGFAIVGSRKIPNTEHTLSFGLYPIFSTLAISGVMTIFHFDIPHNIEWFWLMMAGVLGGLGVICVGKAFAEGTAAIIAPIEYSQLLWATVLGYFIFQDVLTLHVGIGIILIVGSGIALIYSGREKKTKSPLTEVHPS